MAFTMIDIIILVLVIASALMALLRGLTREVLTIIAWVVAALIAYLLFPYIRDTFRGFLTPPLTADVVGYTVLFVVMLIPSLLLANHVIRRFGHDDPGTLDRTGGAIFGIARGLFIVGGFYWLHSIVLEPGSVPSWIQDARLRPVVASVANMFPENIGGFSTPVFAQPPSEDTSRADENEDGGYARQERQNLDQLITTTSED